MAVRVTTCGLVLFELALVLGASSDARAGTTVSVFTPDRDNTLYESLSGDLSNGLGPHLYIGRSRQIPGIAIRRALVAFDLVTIPPGSTILSVELEMFVNFTTDPDPREHRLHVVTADWGTGKSFAGTPGGAGTAAEPGDATWTNRFHPDDPWTLPGGDFIPAPSAIATVAGVGFHRWASTALLVADVQQWVDDPRTNFGWIIMADEATPGSARRFYSGDNPPGTSVPMLTVTYEIDAVPVSHTSWARLKGLF